MSIENNGNNNELAGWNEYRLSVLQQLTYLTNQCEAFPEKLNDKCEKLTDKWEKADAVITKKIDGVKEDVNTLKTSLSVLQVKASLWGGIAGFIITVIVQLLVNFLLKKM